MDVDMEAEDFLELVWGKRKGWVDVPAKVGKNWVSYYTLWDGNGCATSISRRIDASLRDGEDLYFSVGQFRGRGRDYDKLLSSRWLWADLDEVHPTEAAKIGLTPTIAWQSSQGRYQALWKLDHAVPPTTLDKLNQSLSYHLGADLGGWDRTQVLRVVGTRNYKYPEAPLVQLLWHHEDLSYDPRKIWSRVKGSYRPGMSAGALVPDGAGGDRPIPRGILAKLRVPADRVVEGERSSVMWSIEMGLAEVGWGEDAIYDVVSQSAWNKWARIRTGERRLRSEIRKAIRTVHSKAPPGVHAEGRLSEQVSELGADNGNRGLETESLAHGERAGEPQPIPVEEQLDFEVTIAPPVRYDQFMAQASTPPRWLIEGVWTDQAHGIIGGEPKTLKTTLALAMGIAVASGKDFLGTFAVPSPGPVLMVQEENDPSHVRDVMKKVAASYGLISREEATISPSPAGSIGSTVVDVRFPDDIPFHLWNNQGFDLQQPFYRDALEEQVQYIRPRLLILDPLSEMFGDADLDRSEQLRGITRWLRGFRFKYGTGTILIHHLKKNRHSNGGQSMLGSVHLHAWLASALYVTDESEGDDWKRVVINREFREQGPQQAIKVGLRMGPPGSLSFESHVAGFNAGDQLEELVRRAGGRLLRNQAMEDLGLSRKAIDQRAHGHSRLIVESGGGRGRGTYIVLTDEDGNVPSS